MTTLKMAARQTGFYVVVWVSLRVCFLIFSITSFAIPINPRVKPKKDLLVDVLRGEDSPHATSILLL